MLTQTYRPLEKAKAQGINDFLMQFIVSTFALTASSLWGVLGSWTNVNYLVMSICGAGLLTVAIVLLIESSQNKDGNSLEAQPLIKDGKAIN